MLARYLLLAGAPIALAPGLSAQKEYAYTAVPGDPIEARIYTLDNGLTVCLSRNDDAPRVQTNIAVRAGSKHDPADATGLAHYLEHMLFKGTSRYGTQDWERERELLQRISDLYEERRRTRDEDQRDRLYRAIDSLSNIAARIAIPSEYDKMVSSLGARGTNAYTWIEQTVYVNDIPSEELERWMMVEAERFQELVLRLFHTELETVYEEFNMGQDNDGRNASKAMMAALFKDHPYGTQTTIGRGEHLKDPSMEKIHRYFETYYVPNNMAIVLAGDLDYDRTIAMVDKHFGRWQPRDVPRFTFEPEKPLLVEETVEVFGPMAGWVDIGWRMGPAGTQDEVMAALCAGLLSNGQAGLFDLNLLQDQKLLSAYAYATSATDHSWLLVHGEPRQGQTLEDVRALLLEQVQRLQRGEFQDWLIEAVVNDLRLKRIRSWTEGNAARVSALTNAFITQRPWQSVLDFHDRMARVTKAQVMEWAQRHLGNGRVVVYKRTGENRDAYKVPKPPITPVAINRDVKSAWRQEWERTRPAELQPVFVDYAKAIERRSLKSGVTVARVANPSNDLFSLNYILDMGTDHDPALRLAVSYLPYLGTTRYSPTQFKEELFKLGLRIDVNVEDDRTTITLSGLEKNLARGVELLEHLLATAEPNEKALAELINDIVKERQDRLKNKNFILNAAMLAYARFGEGSPFLHALTAQQMRAIPARELTDRIHGLSSYRHRIFYYGRKPLKEVAQLLGNVHRTPRLLREPPAPRRYDELPITRSSVLFLDHDMVQTDVLMVSRARPFDTGTLAHAALFNEYFGSGLSSIVFQEIREAKALAYSARAFYTTPAKADQHHYVRVFIGTQADKLNDAVDALLKLMNDMPMASDQFEGSRQAALRAIAGDRITRQRIYWSWESAQRLGLDHDVRRDTYAALPTIGLEGMRAFFEREIKDRPYTYLVIGKEKNIDFAALEKLGPVRRITKKEIFGYDEEL